MIHDLDRSNYFGASDASIICGNWSTETFANWWKVKTGEIQAPQLSNNKYINAGNAFEGKILDYIQENIFFCNIDRDEQMLIKDSHIRVNLDGSDDKTIYEIKTHQKEWRTIDDIDKNYISQVRFQMFISSRLNKPRKALIVGYQLLEEDYDNYNNEIDGNRLSISEITQDEQWLNDVLIPRLNYLAQCLDKGFFPNESLTFENQLQCLPKEMIENIDSAEISLINIEKEYKKAKEKSDFTRSVIIDYMQKNNIKSFQTDLIKITLVDSFEKTMLDSKKFKEELPEVYEKYKKISISKPSLKITLKENANEV